MLFLGHALLEDENKVWHLVRPVDEMDEGKSKRGSVKEKERTKAITEIYLTRLLSVKVGLRCAAVTLYFYRFWDATEEIDANISHVFICILEYVSYTYNWCSRLQVITCPEEHYWERANVQLLLKADV